MWFASLILKQFSIWHHHTERCVWALDGVYGLCRERAKQLEEEIIAEGLQAPLRSAAEQAVLAAAAESGECISELLRDAAPGEMS